ncbi:ribosome biogenesis protein Kri1 [Purpureocillium lilacinum]|nr:ribosome biogenesis protein Kri1 [Purpureocillium lilacinum]OAQ87177.1 ribosome biogenesis protein Kri1 [Purpureocillium lilacinum]OAQ95133.1 ribosome biogenesis protein Kri1 [Purpureocillium lilacinum]GJN66632.1 KRRI-Interacting protein 1 [Purpureocillium lilacinum]GJN80573.1 KRRI-Interacting protein 1 [Purpureocillium lilacinum]
MTSKSGAADAKRSKRNLLEDSDSDSDDGGAQIETSGFKVNEEYAKRFEHNKKREERHRLEEKYKKDGRGGNQDDDGSDDESSSSNETEDEDGFLATEDLDAQISATLNAIRNKDPRVYDKNITFVQLPDDETLAADKAPKEKPVFLRDYQREKLLRGDTGASDDEDDKPKTYTQEQDDLKKSILSEIKATKGADDSDESDDDDFMKLKEPQKADANGLHPSRKAAIKAPELDVTNADKDPETFLSNFMSSRAWIPEEGGKWKAFESDEGEGDDMADEWEQAYNMRFEDPTKSNEVLKSYARDFAAARSVRREEKTGRKRQREIEREKKEEEKRQKREEKARLRKLKLEETEEKLRKIKQAAGAVGKELTEEEWMQFLDGAWENERWEEEMQKRFGDDYYAMEDDAAKSDDGEEEEEGSGNGKKKKAPKKPKWDDDIDIKDIIPDFEDEEAKPAISLSDEDNQGEEAAEDEDEESRPSKKRKTADHKRVRLESQKAARKERQKLEALVDSKMELEHHDVLGSSSGAMTFRYRETSPQSFGMTARDILLAPSDKDLNDYAGLKKLATFRDEEKKRKDKKRLGKKARLREWRRGVFGREFEREGPTYGFERFLAAEEEGAPAAEVGASASHKHGQRKEKKTGDAAAAEGEEQSNIVGETGGSRKKRKRSKGKNKAAVDAEA